ncbi:hypothetical protein O3W44_22825 [Pantoea sp. LMR881]|uniref:hypothetical protein n=1 Tax=Pantoea sp. LMR881 TaxID=3014336 RepID=UPI0022B013A0|nr:hypothetical protein [Pantoea sp. LMR881]MCZ4061369.1 hypothetical protein [Pantoea sp. LMR881]
MNEIDSLLRVTGEGVSVKLGDNEAQQAKVEEWLLHAGRQHLWPARVGETRFRSTNMNQ